MSEVAALLAIYVVVAVVVRRLELRIYPLSKEAGIVGAVWPALLIWKICEFIFWCGSRVCAGIDWLIFDCWRRAK